MILDSLGSKFYSLLDCPGSLNKNDTSQRLSRPFLLLISVSVALFLDLVMNQLACIDTLIRLSNLDLNNVIWSRLARQKETRFCFKTYPFYLFLMSSRLPSNYIREKWKAACIWCGNFKIKVQACTWSHWMRFVLFDAGHFLFPLIGWSVDWDFTRKCFFVSCQLWLRHSCQKASSARFQNRLPRM